MKFSIYLNRRVFRNGQNERHIRNHRRTKKEELRRSRLGSVSPKTTVCVCGVGGGCGQFYSHLVDISYLPSVFGHNISSPYMSLNLDKTILLHVVVS